MSGTHPMKLTRRQRREIRAARDIVKRAAKSLRYARALVEIGLGGAHPIDHTFSRAILECENAHSLLSELADAVAPKGST